MKTKFTLTLTALFTLTASGALADIRPHKQGHVQVGGPSFVEPAVVQDGGGGAIEATVVSQTPNGGTTKKHIGAVKWSNITIVTTPALNREFYNWLKPAFDKGHSDRLSGYIMPVLSTLDFKREVRTKREFRDALLTEVTFPTMDGAAKDPADPITITFMPEVIKDTLVKPDSKRPPIPRPWRPNFRITFEGLEADSAKVSKIDGFSIKWPVKTGQVGDIREPVPTQSAIVIPQITLSFNRAAPQFQAWADDFLLKGYSTDAYERNAILELLDERDRPLLTFALKNTGVAAHQTALTSDDRTVQQATIYVESMELISGAAPRAFMDQFFSKSRGTATGAKATRSIASQPE